MKKKVTKDMANHLYTSRWHLTNMIEHYEKRIDLEDEVVKESVREGSLEFYRFLHLWQNEEELSRKKGSRFKFSQDLRGAKEVDLVKAGLAREWSLTHNKQGERPVNTPFWFCLHWSMGSSWDSTMHWGRDKNLRFSMIKKDGELIVPKHDKVTTWGYAVGRATNSYGIPDPETKYCYSVETDCAGLAKYESSTGGYHPAWHYKDWNFKNSVMPGRKAMFKESQMANKWPGYPYDVDPGVKWVKLTDEQIDKVIELDMYFRWSFGDLYKGIVFHDEMAGWRGKRDMGASLDEMSYDDFRALLNDEWDLVK